MRHQFHGGTPGRRSDRVGQLGQGHLPSRVRFSAGTGVPARGFLGDGASPAHGIADILVLQGWQLPWFVMAATEKIHPTPVLGEPTVDKRQLRITIPMLSARWHGGARVLLQAANYCVSRGHHVTVLCPRGHFTSNYELDSRVTVRHLGSRTGWKLLDYIGFLVSVPFTLPRDATAVANFFVTYLPVRLAALIRGVPYV